jgi:4-amino-4-deoxy-L-arabinose transferase-like glycosyltransferase
MKKSLSKQLTGGVAILLVALVARLAAVAGWGPQYEIRGTVDDLEYAVLAQNLRHHGAFSYGTPGIARWGDRVFLDAHGPYEPVATRAPLLPFMIAALWRGGDPPVLRVQIVQCLLGSLTALMVYLFSLRAFGKEAAVLSGFMVALGPLTLYFTTFVLTETLFTFLFAGFAMSWAVHRGITAGILLGLATLARSVCLPLVGLLFIAGLFLRFNRSLHLKIALAAVLVIAPWTLRNAITQQAFIPVSTIGWGANLLLGTIHVPYGTGYTAWTFEEDAEYMGIRRTAASVRDAEAQMAALALKRVREAPLQWLFLRIEQYPRFWSSSGGYITMAPAFRYLYLGFSVGFWLLAVAGAVMLRRRWREFYPLAVVPAAMAALHFIGSADERYSLPLVPMAAIFAGYALSACFGRLVRREDPKHRGADA